MKKRADPAWTTRSLKEVEVGSQTWKAQISENRGGRKFYGIRSFISLQDGTEISTRNGFSVSEEHVGELHKLKDLIDALLKKEEIKYVFRSPEGKFVVHKVSADAKVKVTSDVGKAIYFRGEAAKKAAMAWAKQVALNSKWKLEPV